METISDGIYVTFAAITSFICVAGGVLNGLTIATFIRHRSLLIPSNIIIFSMCLSDLISSVVASPIIVVANVAEKCPFGDSGCQAYAFVTTLCGLSSINHLAGAAYERYDTMNNSTRGNGLFSRKRTIIFVLLLWAYSLIFSIVPLMGWSSYTIEVVGTSCSVNWSSSSPNSSSYIFFLYHGCFVLPLGVMVFSYYKMYRIVKAMDTYAKNTWGTKSVATVDALMNEKKMAVLILAMIAAFLISWTPYAVVALISSTGHADMVSELASSVPAYLAKLSCIHNPIIYALIFKSFRQKMWTLMPTCNKLFKARNEVSSIALPPIQNQERNILPSAAVSY